MSRHPAALCVVGGYEVHPLSVCSEDAIAALFAKICNRGNPLLQGKPHEDLLRLGIAFYRKSSPYLGSVACLMDGEPVALQFGWDCADGGIWKGTDGPPASLLAHGAVGGACWGSWPVPFVLPENPGQVWFGAFGGVSLPHPGTLMGLMSLITFPWMIGMGYRFNFGYVVHPSLIEQQKRMEASLPIETIEKMQAQFRRWVITYNEIEVSDPDVKAELSSLKPGYTNCSLMEMEVMMASFDAENPFIKATRAIGDRLCTWGSDAYNAASPPVLALPGRADFEGQAKAKL